MPFTGTQKDHSQLKVELTHRQHLRDVQDAPFPASQPAQSLRPFEAGAPVLSDSMGLRTDPPIPARHTGAVIPAAHPHWPEGGALGHSLMPSVPGCGATLQGRPWSGSVLAQEKDPRRRRMGARCSGPHGEHPRAPPLPHCPATSRIPPRQPCVACRLLAQDCPPLRSPLVSVMLGPLWGVPRLGSGGPLLPGGSWCAGRCHPPPPPNPEGEGHSVLCGPPACSALLGAGTVPGHRPGSRVQRAGGQRKA